MKGPLFYTFHRAFYKNFVIVFWNKYSPFVAIFIMIAWKLGRYNESSKEFF